MTAVECKFIVDREERSYEARVHQRNNGEEKDGRGERGEGEDGVGGVGGARGVGQVLMLVAGSWSPDGNKPFPKKERKGEGRGVGGGCDEVDW